MQDILLTTDLPQTPLTQWSVCTENRRGAEQWLTDCGQSRRRARYQVPGGGYSTSTCSYTVELPCLLCCCTSLPCLHSTIPLLLLYCGMALKPRLKQPDTEPEEEEEEL